MTMHVVSGEVFDRLAQGDGDTLGVLHAGQRSRRLLLLHALVSELRSNVPSGLAQAAIEDAYALLLETQRGSPHTVDEVLLQPQVGAWATHCLRTLAEGVARAEEIGHLGAIAAAAALRAGQAFDVTTHLRDGTLMLPTFGLVRLSGHHGWCRIRSRPAAGGVELTTHQTVAHVSLSPAGDSTRWLSLRHLRSSAAGITIDVLLDDIDPYRGCGELPVAPRLSSAAVSDWQAKLDDAWASLVSSDRARAAAIAAGVTSLVPLRTTEEAPELSATCHDSLGAVAMTHPPAPRALFLGLVHEFQHTKLSTLLDLVPLVGRSPDMYYAPWRTDPRPLHGLLQGSYAYLGLADATGRSRPRGRPESPASDELLLQFEFALWRDQVGRALGSLRRSGQLTSPGRRFVEGMHGRLSRLRCQPVASQARLLARVACIDNATSWRLRNVSPDPEQVMELADAWRRGRSRPTHELARPRVRDGGGPLPSAPRLALLRHRLAVSSRDGLEIVGTSSADVDLLAGRLRCAADAYRRQIVETPTDLASWAGLGLVSWYLPDRAMKVLGRVPEVVRAVHQSILERTGAAPDPDDIARWMAAAR